MAGVGAGKATSPPLEGKIAVDKQNADNDNKEEAANGLT